MARLLIFGMGYTASRLAARLRKEGWRVTGVGRTARNGVLAADDPGIPAEIAAATHILASAPPDEDGDPVLRVHGALLAATSASRVYLSSTGVYGDAGGAWVDEAAPLAGRRANRIAADLAWQAAGATVLRLPGIYGPDRSVLDRVSSGRAHRVDLPDQVFSRVHVDDIGSGIRAAFDGPVGVYNLADDLPASQNRLVEAACAMLGRPLPPLLPLEEAGLSPMARAFYAENRRVAAGRAKRRLGWRPLYPDYRAGLRALSATISPSSVSAPPAAA